MILTVGHSAHPAAVFASLLLDAGVEVLVDVRRYPMSRRNPQFRRDELERWLPPRGVAYRFSGDQLGGQRDVASPGRHAGLDPGLAGYADHMTTAGFTHEVERVLHLAEDRTIALMCAEADPTQCHRSLLSDAIVRLHDTPVVHLLRDGSVRSHEVSPRARVEDGALVYDVAVDRPLF